MSIPGRPLISRNALILIGIAAAVIVVAVNQGEIDRLHFVYFAVLIPSVILHEVSHGAVALLFGDDTAKRAGRLTLNPVAHVDLWGTLIIPIALILTTGLAFGYAKPVPVNTARMTRDQAMMTSLCGPAVNIVIALLTAVVLNMMHAADWGGPDLTWDILFELGIVNVVLAVFNLLPIPPLDGAAVVERFLPRRYWPTYLVIRQWAMIALIFLVLVFQGSLNLLFNPAIELWSKLLPWAFFT